MTTASAPSTQHQLEIRRRDDRRGSRCARGATRHRGASRAAVHRSSRPRPSRSRALHEGTVGPHGRQAGSRVGSLSGTDETSGGRVHHSTANHTRLGGRRELVPDLAFAQRTRARALRRGAGRELRALRHDALRPNLRATWRTAPDRREAWARIEAGDIRADAIIPSDAHACARSTCGSLQR